MSFVAFNRQRPTSASTCIWNAVRLSFISNRSSFKLIYNGIRMMTDTTYAFLSRTITTPIQLHNELLNSLHTDMAKLPSYYIQIKAISTVMGKIVSGIILPTCVNVKNWNLFNHRQLFTDTFRWPLNENMRCMSCYVFIYLVFSGSLMSSSLTTPSLNSIAYSNE